MGVGWGFCALSDARAPEKTVSGSVFRMFIETKFTYLTINNSFLQGGRLYRVSVKNTKDQRRNKQKGPNLAAPNHRLKMAQDQRGAPLD